jgi:hypothetical protein
VQVFVQAFGGKATDIAFGLGFDGIELFKNAGNQGYSVWPLTLQVRFRIAVIVVIIAP